MNASAWTASDTAEAKRIWAEYQEQNDLSDCLGKTAGIDPHTGRVWIGESIHDVLAQRDVNGSDALLFFERIGSETYYRKGGRQLRLSSLTRKS